MSLIDYGRFQTVTKRKIALLEEASTIAKTDNPLLILGEKGTGKKELSVFIHENSQRNLKSIIYLNNNSFNYLQITNEDTVVIEELESFSDSQQKALLGLVTKSLKNNLNNSPRWIATASLDIPAKVKNGEINLHLYHALSTNRLYTLNLKERLEDLVGLAEGHFKTLNHLCQKNKTLSEIQKNIILGRSYHQNFLDFYQFLDEMYTKDTIHQEFTESSLFAKVQVGITLSEMEKKLILQTLEMTHQNRTRAAEILGISIRTLRNKLNEYKTEVSHESAL